MTLTDTIANSVVLESEKCVQQLHAEPPIITEARLGCPIPVPRYEERLVTDPIQVEFAILVLASQFSCDDFAGTINLRAIPPSGIDITISGTELVGRMQFHVSLGLEQTHTLSLPIVFW